MRLPGRSRAPISIRSGVPTAAATTSQISSALCRELAAALESLETSFHQDLNGDGMIGVPTIVIESAGSTSLTEVGINFYLYNSSGSGPELKYAGAAVVTGEFGTWAPIGAELTTTGYEVAWKATGADLYTAWSTDSSGNYTSNIIGAVSGTSSALESLETSFYQDLNGDGMIGVPTIVIELAGSTSLTEVGINFYLYNSSGSGPELKYAGAAVVTGEFGTWAPIGAELTTTGYEVAWKATGADLYTAWSTDSSGNYTSNIIGAVSGTSSALESLETSFYQDLNGDGMIGVPTTVIEANGNIQLSQMSQAATIDRAASYSLGNFKFASDDQSGTMVYDSPTDASTQTTTAPAVDHSASQGGTSVIAPAATSPSGTTMTATSANQTLAGAGSNDTFVFSPAFGNATITNFQPTSDVIQIDHSVFANVESLLAATHDDGDGNVVITADSSDAITLQNMTLTQLQAHQSDFHII